MSHRSHWSTIVTSQRHGPAQDCLTSGSTTARRCTIELAASSHSSALVGTTKLYRRFANRLQSLARSLTLFRSTAIPLERFTVTTWSWLGPTCMLFGAATQFLPTIALSP